ncbi:hypothetical protein AVEN_88239-1, partial [Araneus ventricosus]
YRPRGWRTPGSKPDSTEYPTCTPTRYRLNYMKGAKRSPPGVEEEIGEEGSSPGAVLVMSVEQEFSDGTTNNNK